MGKAREVARMLKTDQLEEVKKKGHLSYICITFFLESKRRQRRLERWRFGNWKRKWNATAWHEEGEQKQNNKEPSQSRRHSKQSNASKVMRVPHRNSSMWTHI